jgi:tetratricopeptide (TPR) repeat protein
MADAGLAEELSLLLDDRNAWIRSAAIALQRQLPEQRRVKALAPLLNDDMQSVRIEAARALLGIPPEGFPVDAQVPLKNAMAEFQRSLLAKADFPESQLVIGGVALILKNLPAATSAFQHAVAMDPQLVQAWVMLSRIQAVEGDREAVRKTLETAIEANPGNAVLQQALRDLGNSGYKSR